MISDEELERILQQLETRGAVSVTAADGKLFFFRRDIIENLLKTMDDTGRDYTCLFITSNYLN